MDRYGRTLEAIREMVTDESIVKNGRLPTERELCSMIGVGRRLLRRALDTLEIEGVLVRSSGRFSKRNSCDGPSAPGAGVLGTVSPVVPSTRLRNL